MNAQNIVRLTDERTHSRARLEIAHATHPIVTLTAITTQNGVPMSIGLRLPRVDLLEALGVRSLMMDPILGDEVEPPPPGTEPTDSERLSTWILKGVGPLEGTVRTQPLPNGDVRLSIERRDGSLVGAVRVRKTDLLEALGAIRRDDLDTALAEVDSLRERLDKTVGERDEARAALEPAERHREAAQEALRRSHRAQAEALDALRDAEAERDAAISALDTVKRDLSGTEAVRDAALASLEAAERRLEDRDVESVTEGSGDADEGHPAEPERFARAWALERAAEAIERVVKAVDGEAPVNVDALAIAQWILTGDEVTQVTR